MKIVVAGDAAHELRMLGLPAPIGSGMRNQTRGNYHLCGRAVPGSLDEAQFGFLHETRLADSLNTHSSPSVWRIMEGRKMLRARVCPSGAGITTLVLFATLPSQGSQGPRGGSDRGRGRGRAQGHRCAACPLIYKGGIPITKKRIINRRGGTAGSRPVYVHGETSE